MWSNIGESQQDDHALGQAVETTVAVGRAKSQFLANMNHELRTPMSGILGMLQLALQEELAPVPRAYLQMTLGAALSLHKVLDDILSMTSIEAGRMAIEEQSFSPRKCIVEAVASFIPELRRKGLKLVDSGLAELPQTAFGDQLRLRQVLDHLIGNAVKFTRGGSVELRVAAGAKCVDGKRRYTFSITDTGIGIPNDKKDLLFRAFSQVDGSQTRRYGGTGLGLAISKEIVELMGGEVSFESEEGVGSTFRFTIPLGERRSKRSTLVTGKTRTLKKATCTEAETVPRLGSACRFMEFPAGASRWLPGISRGGAQGGKAGVSRPRPGRVASCEPASFPIQPPSSLPSAGTDPVGRQRHSSSRRPPSELRPASVPPPAPWSES